MKIIGKARLRFMRRTECIQCLFVLVRIATLFPGMNQYVTIDAPRLGSRIRTLNACTQFADRFVSMSVVLERDGVDLM